MLVIVKSILSFLIIFTMSVLNACVLILRKVTIGDKFEMVKVTFIFLHLDRVSINKMFKLINKIFDRKPSLSHSRSNVRLNL